MKFPEHYKLTYSAEQIRQAVCRLAGEITPWAAAAASRGTDAVIIPILRGGIYFFADLAREIDCSMELAPVRVRTYLNAVNAAQRAEVEIGLEGLEVRGRTLLLVDDICDTGRTLQTLSERLRADGAAEVKSAVLIRRKTSKDSFLPDWTCFEYEGPEWFVGYGMEDKNRFTNLPSIYAIPPE